MKKFLIPITKFNQIYQAAHAVLEKLQTPEKSCVFFACFGAYVLNKHYQIKARVVAGAFGLCVNDNREVAFFAEESEGYLTSSGTGFHMWVQTETHIFDFMSPIFSESFHEKLAGSSFPRKMLQRAIATEAKSPEDLLLAGDFFTLPNIKLTQEVIDMFFARQGNSDMMIIANQLLLTMKKKQPKIFGMIDDLGQQYELALPKTIAIGSW